MTESRPRIIGARVYAFQYVGYVNGNWADTHEQAFVSALERDANPWDLVQRHARLVTGQRSLGRNVVDFRPLYLVSLDLVAEVETLPP